MSWEFKYLKLGMENKKIVNPIDLTDMLSTERQTNASNDEPAQTTSDILDTNKEESPPSEEERKDEIQATTEINKTEEV